MVSERNEALDTMLRVFLAADSPYGTGRPEGEKPFSSASLYSD